MTPRRSVLASVLTASMFVAVVAGLDRAAEGAELAGVGTGLRVGTGAVRVKAADTSARNPARPLMPLDPSDQIRTEGDRRK